MKKLKKALWCCAMNNLMVNWALGLVLYPAQVALGIGFHPRDLPAWPIILRDFIVFIIVQNLYFTIATGTYSCVELFDTSVSVVMDWGSEKGLLCLGSNPLGYFYKMIGFATS